MQCAKLKKVTIPKTKKLIKMKIKILLSLLIGMIGVIAFSGCEKKYTTKNDGVEIVKKNILGEWKCTNYRYNRDGVLKLIFEEDSIQIINTTSQKSIFDNRTYCGFDFAEDTMKMYYYIDENDYFLYSPFTFSLSNSRLSMSFLGGMSQPGDMPDSDYNFKKIR